MAESAKPSAKTAAPAETTRPNCFRILIIGSDDAVKMRILQKICKTTDEPEIFDSNGERIDPDVIDPTVTCGKRDIENEMVFASNRGFVFHSSPGFKSNNTDELEKVLKFIGRYGNSMYRQIHAIWYCISTAEERPITEVEVRLFSGANYEEVPVVAIFTKPDLLRHGPLGSSDKMGAERLSSLRAIEDFLQSRNQVVFPPKHLYLENLETPETDCAELIKVTSSALANNEIQELLVSTYSIEDKTTLDEREQVRHQKVDHTTAIQDPPVRGETGLPSSCIVAELALREIEEKQDHIRDLFQKHHQRGLFYIQAGFNEDFIRLGHGRLQEIYIFLEHRVAEPALVESLRNLIPSFPFSIFTPQDTHYRSHSKGNWDLLTRLGIYCPNLSRSIPPTQTTALPANHSAHKTPGGRQTEATGGGKFPSRGGSGGSKGKFRAFDDDSYRGGGDETDGDDETDGGDGGGGDGDGGGGGGPGESGKDADPASICIPFSSTLNCGEGPGHSRVEFEISSRVDIKVVKSRHISQRPPGSVWGEPWLQAEMPFLSTTASTMPGTDLDYRTGFAQIQIIASSASTSLLEYSPPITHAEGDGLKATQEKNRTLGVRGTASGTPSIRIDASSSRSFGEEQVHNRWGIMVHHRHTDDPCSRSVVWKYSINDMYYQRRAGESLRPGPSVMFGFARPGRVPRLEVDIVTHWSLLSPKPSRSQRFSWLTTSPRPKDPPPAFANLLHQATISVDLSKAVGEVSFLGLDSANEHDLIATNQRPFEPVLQKSGCLGVTLKVAIRGQIG